MENKSLSDRLVEALEDRIVALEIENAGFRARDGLQIRWQLKQIPGGQATTNSAASKVGGALPGGYKKPTRDDFEAIQEPLPTSDQLKDGEVLFQHQFLSVDPYVAAYCMGQDNVGKTVVAGASGIVLASKSDKFAPGDSAVGNGGAAEMSIMSAEKLRKISSEPGSAVEYDPQQLPSSLALGVLGMPGATAWFAIKDILGAELKGQTVVVSGSAGAVGSIAGQLCKLFGAAKVVGIAGSDAKCELCKSRYKYDAMINYKTADLPQALEQACGAGNVIDAYFDNVGGRTAKAVKALMKDRGNVAKVGSIGGDGTDEANDPRLNIKGFYAGGILDRWPEAIRGLAKYINEDQLNYDETAEHGIARFPQAMITMLAGGNRGKMVVRL